MKRLLAAFALTIVSACTGGGAPELTVTKAIDIDAPASEVWAIVKDYDALNRWHPAVAKDEIVEGANNTVGAVRVLTLGDGGTIREKLLAYDENGRSMRYNILEGVLPVSSYESTISVAENGEASKVTWTGTFKRKDTGPSPAAGADDATAKTTMEGVYQAGLDNLKKMVEAQ